MTAVLVAGLLPMVFWMSRAVIGYSGGVSVIVAGLFGINPILWYAYAHVSPGQLLAAQAVSLLTWAGVALWRGRLTWARAVQFFGVMAAGYWLVLGSYNFFLLVCLVPAVAYAGGLALWRRAWRRFGAWLLFMVVPLVGCGALFAERMAGLGRLRRHLAALLPRLRRDRSPLRRRSGGPRRDRVAHTGRPPLGRAPGGAPPAAQPRHGSC